MKKAISPCYKCEERHVGCHGQCEKYQEYAGIGAENREERSRAKEAAIKSHTKKSVSQQKDMGIYKEKR